MDLEKLFHLSRLTAGDVVAGALIGLFAWFLVRHLIFGFFAVDQNERAVITSFGRAQRLREGAGTSSTSIGGALREDEKERYDYPQVRVIPAGGPYFKWPWQRVHKVSIATETVNLAWDPEDKNANEGGTVLEAVTKDQLNVGLTGQLRWRVSEDNLYAYLFGVKHPIVHVMGFFISVLRQRIANFEAPARGPDLSAIGGPGGLGEPAAPSAVAVAVQGISINDLRKNLRSLNEIMDRECSAAPARYGVVLDASLITSIDPPQEVELALAAINTAHNQVSSDISLAQASADQKIVQSRRAVEIETLNAHAEVEPLVAMAGQLAALKASGPEALGFYLRNVRLSLYGRADRVILEVNP